MSDAHISFDDEEIEAGRFAVRFLLEHIKENRRICESDFSTKEEVASAFGSFLTLFEEILVGGSSMLEGSIEINKIINDPDSLKE